MMTRKKYIKLMMAAGWNRNEAEHIASFGKTEQGQVLSARMKKRKLAHRGCWPCDTYDELLNFCFDVDMLRRHSATVESPVSLFEEM
jgi:hypothetical protein